MKYDGHCMDRLTDMVIRAEHKAAEEESACEWCGGKEECREGCKLALEGNLMFSEFFNETRGC